MGSPSRNVQYHPPRLSEDRLNLSQPHSPSLLTHCSGKSGMRPTRPGHLQEELTSRFRRASVKRCDVNRLVLACRICNIRRFRRRRIAWVGRTVFLDESPTPWLGVADFGPQFLGFARVVRISGRAQQHDQSPGSDPGCVCSTKDTRFLQQRRTGSRPVDAIEPDDIFEYVVGPSFLVEHVRETPLNDALRERRDRSARHEGECQTRECANIAVRLLHAP